MAGETTGKQEFWEREELQTAEMWNGANQIQRSEKKKKTKEIENNVKAGKKYIKNFSCPK